MWLKHWEKQPLRIPNMPDEDPVVVVTDGGHIIPRGKNMLVSFQLEHVHLFDTKRV